MIGVLVFGCCVDWPKAGGEKSRKGPSDLQSILAGIDIWQEGTIDLGYGTRCLHGHSDAGC